jgi:hypothetical protein
MQRGMRKANILLKKNRLISANGGDFTAPQL